MQGRAVACLWGEFNLGQMRMACTQAICRDRTTKSPASSRMLHAPRRHCEERSDAAIRGRGVAGKMDCHACGSMKGTPPLPMPHRAELVVSEKTNMEASGGAHY